MSSKPVDFTGTTWTLDTTNNRECNFGTGKASSMVIATMNVPFCGEWFQLNMHITDDRPPRLSLAMIFSLADMDRLRIFYNSTNDILVCCPENLIESVRRFYGHAVYRWNATINFFYREAQFCRLRRRFGHQDHMKLFDLLQRSKPEEITCATIDVLRKIEK